MSINDQMKILITGAAGTVGEASLQYFSAGHQVVGLSHGELDITDTRAVQQRIVDEQPQVVINCAVLGVDSCEDDPLRARQVNAEGPRNLAAACALVDAEMLHFSSNYVFSGQLTDRAYTIEDTPDPINEYGRTKLAGELAVSEALPKSYIVRTSWVFGGESENFLSKVPGNLVSGRRISAITDIQACTTFVDDLISRVAEVLTHKRYGIYHVVNDGACSYFEFAREAARILALPDTTTLIEPVSEEAARRKARRPRYSPLRCLLSAELGLAPMRDWRQALGSYIEARGMLNR
jgi:dTDP-4-dehydrorhamnose reductase